MRIHCLTRKRKCIEGRCIKKIKKQRKSIQQKTPVATVTLFIGPWEAKMQLLKEEKKDLFDASRRWLLSFNWKLLPRKRHPDLSPCLMYQFLCLQLLSASKGGHWSKHLESTGKLMSCCAQSSSSRKILEFPFRKPLNNGNGIFNCWTAWWRKDGELLRAEMITCSAILTGC